MPLSWNEIRDRAHRFARDWAEASNEDADAKTFWDEFFTVFGLTRRRVASFETRVKKIDGKDGYIDLLWKGILLVEHKSRGKDLDAAHRQALDYFHGIKERDLPHWVLVSDFERFRLYNLDAGTQQDFKLKDLPANIKLFGFIAGYQTTKFREEDPVNVEAAEKMGRLHDALKESGYTGHALELLLVRLLFCLFAEDAGAFSQRRQFQDYIEQRTAPDGADLGGTLAGLFDVLNTPKNQRQKTLDEQLAEFEYVNGELFAERLPVASFNKDMREALLECCALDWSKISPAIFGAMFQSIMDEKLRRSLGAHYTSEKNIMKVIGPLFLDDLKEEFGRVKGNAKQLEAFHKKLASLKFLDPACGCGNFLIIAYREIRELELECLRILLKKKDSLLLDVSPHILCNVDQFYGIEVEEFPAQIARTAMWLMDHQMNMKVGAEFGQYISRLPLIKKATIVHGNALRVNWEDVVKPSELNYILGNPPFVGYAYMSQEQSADMEMVFRSAEGTGVLDFVSGWYKKAVDYLNTASAYSSLQGNSIRCAFVSTNSITQGEQVSALWPDLLKNKVRIHFAHRTFKWTNEASGQAAVHCVIIGFGLNDVPIKRLFDYDAANAEPHELKVQNINPYLVAADDVIISKSAKPICAVPEITKGNQPTDDGQLLMSDEEKIALVKKDPRIKKFIKPFISAKEFLNNMNRWCLWLENISPSEIKSIPELYERVENVRKFRKSSKKKATVKLADTPSLFAEIRQPSSNYLLVPRHSSENRAYIPFGFLDKDKIVADSCSFVPNATLYHFGVMSSLMHMGWVRYVCGRIKSDYRYSNSIVYNNFPWPEPSAEQEKAIEKAAQGVLDARDNHKGASLADLYDPNTMPPDLVKAHRALDAAVDAAYSKKKFTGDSDRVAHLFALYQKLVAPLDAAPAKPAKKKKAKKTGAE